MTILTKKEINKQIKNGALEWQIRTGLLRDLYSLKLEELPLQKISFRGKDIFAISENLLEEWLIHNSFDVYPLEEYFDDCDIDSVTYEDIEDEDITIDYGVLYDFVRDLGFKVINLEEVLEVDDSDNWSFENVFEGKKITKEEAGNGCLGFELVDVGSVAFLLENTDPSTIQMEWNHFLYDYNNSL